MHVRFSESSKDGQDKSDVNVNARLESDMSSLLKMKTCGCIFNQGFVKIVITVFSLGQPLEQNSEEIVKCTLQSLVGAFLHERQGLVENVLCIDQAIGNYLNHARADHKNRFQLIVRVTYTLDCAYELNACFVICSLAPIAQPKFTACLG